MSRDIKSEIQRVKDYIIIFVFLRKNVMCYIMKPMLVIVNVVSLDMIMLKELDNQYVELKKLDKK